MREQRTFTLHYLRVYDSLVGMIPPQSEEDYKAFCLAIDDALVLLFDAFERNPRSGPIPPPLDWPGVQSALREIAERLMLCTEVGAATLTLTNNPAALLTVAMAVNRISFDDHLHLRECAYRETGPHWRSLPGAPMAHFVLALSAHIEPPH